MRLALISARGGSKRMPKKNIVPFCGKLMITNVIEVTNDLLNAGLFNLVCTDEHLIVPASWSKL